MHILCEFGPVSRNTFRVIALNCQIGSISSPAGPNDLENIGQGQPKFNQVWSIVRCIFEQNFLSYRVTCGQNTQIWPIFLSKILPKLQISKFWKSPSWVSSLTQKTLSCWISGKLVQKQLRKCPETIPSTDDDTDDADGRTDTVNPIYPPTNYVGRGV